MRLLERFRLQRLLCILLLYIVLPDFLRAMPVEQTSLQFGLPLAEIQVSGNEKTQSRFILKWAELETGKILSRETLQMARQKLRDTGLFIEIEFSTRLVGTDHLLLLIRLKEKHFSLLLPRLSRNGDGDIRTGLRLRMHNLQGADQTLDILAQRETLSDGGESDEIRIGYNWPLYSKAYEISWQISQISEHTDVEGFSNKEYTDFFLIEVEREWHLAWFDIPLDFTSALAFEKKELDRPYPEALDEVEAGEFNRLKIELAYDDVHDEPRGRFGSFYSISIERGLTWLNSDFESIVVELQMRGYRPRDAYDNLNYRFVLSLADNAPFNGIAFSIGGASSLRGLADIETSGDVRFFTNIEYLFGYHDYPNFHSSLFVDVGNVYDDLQSTDLTDLRYTLGVGVRWKIESFVDTDLFIDYGYDIEESFGKVYGGTSLIF